MSKFKIGDYVSFNSMIPDINWHTLGKIINIKKSLFNNVNLYVVEWEKEGEHRTGRIDSYYAYQLKLSKEVMREKKLNKILENES